MKLAFEEVFAGFDRVHEEAKVSIQNMLTTPAPATESTKE